MSLRNFANNDPGTTLSSGINAAVTTVPVASTAGFPASTPFTAVLDYGTGSAEAVLVTGVAGLNLTVTRGYNSTTAVSHVSGGTIQHQIVALDFTEANSHVNASTNVHGTSSAVVGKDDVQTLTNKTLATPTLTGTTTAAAVTASGAVAVAGALTATGAGTGLAVTNNETVGGTLAVAGATTLTKATGTGLAVTADTTVGGALTVTGAAVAASFTGVIIPKVYANEAAAGAASAGLIVYLTTPTTSGYTAGPYRGNGTIWVPVNPLSDSNSVQSLLFAPAPGPFDTSTTTTATWFTAGNVTVPAWATKCVVTYSINGIITVATGINCTSVIKIGAVSGAVSKRIFDNGTTAGRGGFTVTDALTGLATGAQSVTVSATWVAGVANSYRLDAGSYFTAQFTFLP